jgi:hypothetical protein
MTITTIDVRTCGCCNTRPALAWITTPGDEIRLCGTCLDDAYALGMVDIGATTGAVPFADGKTLIRVPVLDPPGPQDNSTPSYALAVLDEAAGTWRYLDEGPVE